MLFSDFETSVKDRLTVDANRAGVAAGLDRKIADYCRELQSFIPLYREGQETTYQEDDFTSYGEASLASLPDGAEVQDAYYLSSTNQCKQQPLVPYDWDNRFDLVCGNVNICRGYYIAIDPQSTKFLVYPKIEPGGEVLLCWNGLKQSFADADLVPFTEEFAACVAAGVKAWVSKEVDKDLALANAYMVDYTVSRTNLYLDAKRRSEIKNVQPSPAPDGECSCGVEADETVEFCFVSDTGEASPSANTSAVANLVKSLHPDFIVHGGDALLDGGDPTNLYDILTRHYYGWIPDSFYLAFGNHDTEADAGAAIGTLLTTQAALNGGKFYYDFTVGSVHICVLNSNPEEPDGIDSSSVQATWLQGVLAAHPDEWNIVFCHKAPYTSDLSHTVGEVPLRWPFGTWGADLVVSGHGHNYERIAVDGLTYLVCGLGGDTIRDFALSAVVGSLFQYNDLHGCLRFTATDERLAVTLYNTSRQAIDQVVLKS